MSRLTRGLLTIILSTTALTANAAPDKPNILWIVAEDTSPWMGCYGDKINAKATPNIDALADAGVRFARAFVPAPVCSPCRSALMGGANQVRFGAHEHRSSRGTAKVNLPRGMKLLPQIMKENGYYTFNRGKTDYNFVWDSEATYSEGKLRDRKDAWNILERNQPFFGQIQIKGGKNNTGKFPKERKVNPADVTVPPDYPQNSLYSSTVAQHYDAIRVDDDVIGKIVSGIKTSGLAGNTIVAYFSDHGAPGLVRHKQMVTEGGLHVPFIVTGPRKHVSGQKVRRDLVNLLDLSATTLAWAGIDIPDGFEGRDLFAPDFKEREFVAAAKDRMDHTLDRVRSLRTDRFRYTRNYKLDRIFLQPQYRDPREYTRNLRQLYATGKLSPKLREIYFGERRAEEFYDVLEDPHQVSDLAGNPAYAAELERHRKLMDGWLAKGDMGEGEEPVAEMKANADGRKWGIGVNPEYEVYRPDSDGDGLSDTWEKVNKRDPKDGRLVFEFDCGGWQTEGWEPIGIDANIAGFLGYLDFPLAEGKGAIRRKGLETAVTRGDKSLAVKLRASEKLKVGVCANGESLGGPKDVTAGDSFATIRWPLSHESNWRGVIQSLRLDLVGNKGAFVEIDSIEVVRE